MTDLPIVTTSSRSSFRRCPQQYVWRFVEGLTPKNGDVDALWFGIGIHIALAEWYQKGYKRGPHPADTFAEWHGSEEHEIRASREEWYDEAKFVDSYDLGVNMLEGYVDEYGKDSEWEIIAIEQPFKIRITNKGKPVALFMSTWDGILRWKRDGKIYLVDHKTASQISLAYLELDDQAGAYWATAGPWMRAKGILKPDEQIEGIFYNFLRKSMPDERPRDAGGAYLNKDGTVSKRQPPPKFVRHIVERSPGEQKTQLQRLANEVTLMNGMVDGTLPIVKNTTKDCPYCPFFDMCVLHEQGNNNWKELARSLYTKQDPFARYTKSASE